MVAFAAVGAIALTGCEQLGRHIVQVTPSPAGVGQNVDFRAFVESQDEKGRSESVRRDQVIFRWDLDGDGVMETDSPTGSPDGSSDPGDVRDEFESRISRSYDRPQTIEIASLAGLRPPIGGAVGGAYFGGGDATVQKQRLVVEEDPPTPDAPPPEDPGNRPPLASFRVSPNPVQPHQQVNFFAGESIDVDGSIVRYEWDLDNLGGTFERDTGGIPNTSTQFDNSGEYTVRLRVTDDEGATAVTSRQVVVRWPTRTGRVPFRAGAMPKFEFAPSGREVNEGQYLLNGNELILNRAKARGTLPSAPFPEPLRGGHDVRWATDYVVTTDIATGATDVEAFVLLTFATGGRACMGANLAGEDGENPVGSFRVIGAIGKASRLRGLGTATGSIDESGRPVVKGQGRFRLADEARFGLGKSRCGPLRRLAPQRG